MDNKQLQIIKKEILHYLTDDFENNQAIFDKKEGWQVFNGTDLDMVMDKVVGGLYSAKRKLGGNNERGREESNRNYMLSRRIREE